MDINSQLFGRVSLKEKAVFAKQLSVMLAGGLHLATALEILARQTTNRYFQSVIATIHKELEEGKPLTVLVSRYPNVFDKVFVNIIRAGEQSGQLELVLKQLSKQLADQYRFYSRLKSALIYPVFVLIAMVAVALLASLKIIPELKGLFEESNLALPWTTRLVIGTSDFLVNYWYIVVIGLIALVFAFRYAARTEQGGHLVDELLLRDPTGLAKRVYMARFSRTLGMMLAAGLPIVESVKVVSEVIGNRIYKQSLMAVAQELERGLPMSVPLRNNPYFPILVSQMIMVGEQTGQLDQTLLELAQLYEEESEEGIQNLSTLFEPLVIVIIGIGIGILVYSIIIPIYNLAQAQ